MQRTGAALTSRAARSGRLLESEARGATPLPAFIMRAKCVKPYLSPLGFSLHCASHTACQDLHTDMHKPYHGHEWSALAEAWAGNTCNIVYGNLVLQTIKLTANPECMRCTLEETPAQVPEHQSLLMTTQKLREAERTVHLPEARGLGAGQGVALLVAGLHVQVAVPGPRQRQHLLALLCVDVPRHL